MKHTLLFLLLTFLTISLGAQSISFEYVDTDGTIVFQNTGSSGQDVVIKGMLTNETDSDINLIWKREVQYIYSSGDDSWESAVCDMNRCYLPHVSEANFTLPASGQSNLDAHIYPDGINGDSAIILIHLEDQTSGDTLLSVSYKFFEDMSLSNEIVTPSTQTLVFPNPAASYFRVKSDEIISSVQLYDILGKQVLESKVQSKDVTLNISHLNRGMYIVRIRGEKGKILKTQRLRKDML